MEMKLATSCSALLLLFTFSFCHGGNIFVFPAEGSHWINMDILLQALHSRGHNITILRSTRSWYIKANASYYSALSMPVEKSIDEKFITNLMKAGVQFIMGTTPWTSSINILIKMLDIITYLHSAVCELVSAVLDDAALLKTLNESKFDLVLSDPCWGGGAILAKYMKLPLVYYVRWQLGEDAHFGMAPSPLSYIPVTGSGFTDKMTFLERVKNMILFLVTDIQNNLIGSWVYQPTCDKYLGPDHDFNQIKTDADIWLMRTDFVFDYPRPTMPNVVYMGGFQCKLAKPLPEHLEDFVQSSGEHGVIIMPMGTFVSELPDDMANEIAAALAKLPQKVIWRYKGKRPASLGNNTLVVDWMPQNDLLGHPKIKLFVAHGGTNGVQEAIYHGVPVVGLPIFYDQHDNLLRLQARGAAKILSIATVDKDDSFLKAIQEVLTEPSYRMNMQRLSRLHRDQPVKPMDKALFWIEFVMRHKGAAHLVTESNKMPWYSYYSVDVVAFSFAVAAFIYFSLFAFLRWICLGKCLRKEKQLQSINRIGSHQAGLKQE